MRSPTSIRRDLDAYTLSPESSGVQRLIAESEIDDAVRQRATARASMLVKDIRLDKNPGMMEVFLAEYGLSTDEGIALMCLAEALLRVPDAATIDDLIEDKIAPSAWGEHLGQSSSSLVNASTWALLFTGKVLDDSERSSGIAGILRSTIKRLGEPLIRTAVKHALKEMGNQFVLGETIEKAIQNGCEEEKNGFTYSYDMLGEAALTAHDAKGYFEAYSQSIKSLAKHAISARIAENPGISIKLSALHPRYEVGQKDRVMTELVPKVVALANLAKQSNMGLNIDAEEADRLDLSLEVIEASLRNETLSGWDGFGVVVQAYGKRASLVIDWLYSLAKVLDRKIMVRLVKGAYWDTEIKNAQVNGLSDFPVFTRKTATDVSYICCAKKLLGLTDRIYPQFATHNAHSVSSILELADDFGAFEFQRLHGMGEAMHRLIMKRYSTKCRIYAPVGAHQDLLAYLVRRLLENGANSSFVNQLVDETVPASVIAFDPFSAVVDELDNPQRDILMPNALFGTLRPNSRGWDLHDNIDLDEIDNAIKPYKLALWHANPLTVAKLTSDQGHDVIDPTHGKNIGTVIHANDNDVEQALRSATDWSNVTNSERNRVLQVAADLYEANFGELFAALIREAGKTHLDAISELREAVDFLRYYGTQAELLSDRPCRGIVICISPWNFPLAIFTGQLSAALAAGNAVIAKPAEQTSIVATIATKLLHQAGVPISSLQLLPGDGTTVGGRLTSDPRIAGVCFTGSTSTAQLINQAMAKNVDPEAILIAETGGINAMLVDSTALPEQAIKDIITSAFQSAGQRCSALRVLYLQEDIATEFLEMLYGAMDELSIGDPWNLDTDIGPVIDSEAQNSIRIHINTAEKDGRLLKKMLAPDSGTFVGPAVIQVSGIADIKTEVFGPVLHVALYQAHQIDQILSDINKSGYGLTFGLHTRIDDRVEIVTSKLHIGNMYINRNQIGAIVESQPFGGEGLSGTGPKAGGPNYVKYFAGQPLCQKNETVQGNAANPIDIQSALDRLATSARPVKPLQILDLPGPTGESNRLSLYPRGTVLCLGPTVQDARRQAKMAREQNCESLIIAPGADDEDEYDAFLDREHLSELEGFAAVALWSVKADLSTARVALAKRDGPIIPLITKRDIADRCTLERHICIDTTASGGNAMLLAQT
jgi:RHH-type transcriptional regulator, proline utilization regulon repressor / proline dehydrogenase / delta 1-pyrroline-5-carboxylate dehydrogenase